MILIAKTNESRSYPLTDLVMALPKLDKVEAIEEKKPPRPAAEAAATAAASSAAACLGSLGAITEWSKRETLKSTNERMNE